MTALFLCKDNPKAKGDVLCAECAAEVAYTPRQRTPWTVEAWLLTGDADAAGKPTMGPASCVMCGAGDLARDAQAARDYRDAQREAL